MMRLLSSVVIKMILQNNLIITLYKILFKVRRKIENNYKIICHISSKHTLRITNNVSNLILKI